MPKQLPTTPVGKEQDESTAQLFAALKRAFPELPNDPMQVVYRSTPFSIRMRIISPKFRGKSMAEREELVNVALESIPDDVLSDIVFQFLLTPGEAKRPTLLHREFDHPGEYL